MIDCVQVFLVHEATKYLTERAIIRKMILTQNEK